jgi:hypothetical protein
MPEISRRQVIQSVAGASLAALASTSVSSCKRPAMAGPNPPDPSLYLIFAGAWAFSFENGGVLVLTTDFVDHSYDLGVSLPQDQPRMTLEKGKCYDVAVKGYSPAGTYSDFVSSLGDQALILNKIPRKPISKETDIRTISLPMPTSISPAALLKGVTIDNASGVKEFPTALALIYSGAWESVTITRADNLQPKVNIKREDLPHGHLSFRTYMTKECNTIPDCSVLNCDKLNDDIDHAKTVFDSLMGLFDFKNAPTPSPVPTITIPKCDAHANGTSHPWPVGIVPGPNANIDRSEVGMPAATCRFSQLHNCASGTVIVGS